MLIAGEQGFQPGLLPGGEQIQAGVQGATGPVERIISTASVAVQGLLDPAPALVEGIAGATRQVARTGSSAQIEAAAAILAETRRSLYLLLADGPEASPAPAGTDG